MELTGLSMTEALGTGWAEAIHPSDRELVFAEWYESARTERQFSMEYRFRTPAGKVNWVFGMAIAIRDESGAIAGYFGTVTDITARKQAEQRLCESEERLRLALESVEEGLWDWKVMAGEVYRSPRWVTILGYSPNELENRIDLRDKLVHPDDKPYMKELLDAHFDRHTPYFEMELRMLTKSGEWKWVLDRGQVVERDDRGQPLRMVGTHKDITERKRSEETLRKRYQQILLLKEIVEAIRQSLDLQKIFQTTAERVGRALNADRAIIYSYIEYPAPQLLCVAEYLTPDTNSLFDLSVPNSGDTYAQQVLSQEGAMRADDIFAEASLEPIWDTCRQLNIKSMLYSKRLKFGLL
jgi:PAS domain S-box-containing protein